MNYIMKIDLNKFNGAREITAENGERGVFIPIDANDLFVPKSRRTISKLFKVRQRTPNRWRQSHVIILTNSRKARELGYEEDVFVGHLMLEKDFLEKKQIKDYF